MRPRLHSIPLGVAICAVALLGTTAGCETERRVIAVRGGLSGIAGAQGGELEESNRASSSASQGSAFSNLVAKNRKQANQQAENIDPRSIRITSNDGEVTLVLSSPRHVVLHLRQTLIQDERDLLFEQVLSNRAKQNYTDQNVDPRAAIDFLFDHRREVLKMLQRMPQGELSPGLYLKKIGRNAYRLELDGARVQGLTITRLDIIWELGVCKLLSVG